MFPPCCIIPLLLVAACQAFVTPSLVNSPRLSSQGSGHYHRVKLWSIKPPEKDQEFKSSVETEVFEFTALEDQSDAGYLPSLALAESVQNLDDEEKQKLGIWAARGILLLVAMLWGTNFASVKYLETLCFHPPCNHPPSEAALARFGVAAMVSIPLLIGKRKDVIFAGLECGLWITIGYITQAMALQTISSGKCAFICSLTVVVVPLMSALFGKPIKLVNIASAIVALTGVGVLEGLIDVSSLASALTGAAPALASVPSAVETSSLTEAAANGGGVLGSIAGAIGVSKGDILALGQPLGFGFSFMRIEHYVEKFEDVENRILTISAAECVMVGFCSLLWVLHDFNGSIPDFGYMLDWHRMIAILWTGIMTTVVAIYFEGFALQVASASEAALTFASEPVWASLFGAWLLREQLGPTSYIGGSIILSACVLGALGDMAGDGDKHPASEEGN